MSPWQAAAISGSSRPSAAASPTRGCPPISTTTASAPVAQPSTALRSPAPPPIFGRSPVSWPLSTHRSRKSGQSRPRGRVWGNPIAGRSTPSSESRMNSARSSAPSHPASVRAARRSLLAHPQRADERQDRRAKGRPASLREDAHDRRAVVEAAELPFRPRDLPVGVAAGERRRPSASLQSAAARRRRRGRCAGGSPRSRRTAPRPACGRRARRAPSRARARAASTPECWPWSS